MPRFKINRKVKPVAEPMDIIAPLEEKVDDTEMDDLSSDSVEAIEKGLSAMKLVSKPQKPVPVLKSVQRPSQVRPKFEEPATVVRPPVKRVQFRPDPRYQPRMHDPYRRKAAMPNPRYRPPRGAKKGRLSYSSRYGPGGAYLDTRVKAVMLYNHCFG